MPVPTYQRQCGRGGSTISPASLRASSHLGTDIAPQLQLGWGMQCAASSQRCLLGLKWWGASQPSSEQEGTILPPCSWSWGAVLGTSAPVVAGIQLCLGPGAGAWWQLSVPGGRRWLCVQPRQAPQPVIHPGATVQSVNPQPAHIWGSNQRSAPLGRGLTLC